MEKSVVLEGVCHFWSETGTEGGYWAFQNAKYIFASTPEWPHGNWSYDGLWVLQDGDFLTIYEKDDSSRIMWEGEIKLHNYTPFTESAFGMWIHSDQEGVDRGTWAQWFFEEYPAKFTPGPNQRKNPA